MTKEVLIHLKGMQTTDAPHGSDEPLELITVGEYYYRNNTHYLLYEEQMEGLDEPIHNLVKIRPGHMEVRKKGPVQTNMVFDRRGRRFSPPTAARSLSLAGTTATATKFCWTTARACLRGMHLPWQSLFPIHSG